LFTQCIKDLFSDANGEDLICPLYIPNPTNCQNSFVKNESGARNQPLSDAAFKKVLL